ncbi:hypothetical protein A8F94_12915 [Bacillus sp. FJAT-27225]|uniref:DUF2750 domain-containing protein n=1 Tax=Bacillus sp. FJAT-27225 TaxID=1743144 RepID=UPI00080C2341|nr:DUF2750 domain-containing protein [Bacillus sp. FJAT-27225]OCA85768.1 hypothetical protein A8F94_12915 [Bacillus sp. FJAT-27225]
MHKKEIETVFSLPAQERYKYFIKKIADYEEVWGLNDGGWAVSEDDNGIKLLPFWPKREFAELSNIEDWSGYKPKKIDLDDFMFKWIPGMKRDGLKVSVFWNNIDSIVISPDRLLEDIEEELENY